MKAILLGFFLSTVIAASVWWTPQERVVHIADSYVGVTETEGNNR